MPDFLDNSNYNNNNNFFGIKLYEIKEINCNNNNISNLGIPFGLFVKQPTILKSKSEKTLKKIKNNLFKNKNKTLKK